MGGNRLYFWVGAAGAAAATAFGAYLATSSSQRDHNFSLIIAIAAAVVGLVVPIVTVIWSNYRRQKLSGRLSNIEIPGGSVTLASEPQTSGQAAAPNVNAEDLRLKVHTVLVSEAEIVLARYLGANVRHAKRLVNQWLLYRQIAYFRNVFGGDPAIAELHLVRWLVLSDKWPALAAALTSDPAKMTALEAADSIAALRKAVPSLAPAKVASQELLAFLKEQPPLAPVLARLVEFRSAPAADAQAGSAGADNGDSATLPGTDDPAMQEVVRV